MAKRSALVADSFSAEVRPGLVASLRISERCCSSSSLVRHSMWVSPVFHFNEYFDSLRFEIARRCVALLQVVVPWRVRQCRWVQLDGRHFDCLKQMSRTSWGRDYCGSISTATWARKCSIPY